MEKKIVKVEFFEFPFYYFFFWGGGLATLLSGRLFIWLAFLAGGGGFIWLALLSGGWGKQQEVRSNKKQAHLFGGELGEGGGATRSKNGKKNKSVRLLIVPFWFVGGGDPGAQGDVLLELLVGPRPFATQACYIRQLLASIGGLQHTITSVIPQHLIHTSTNPWVLASQSGTQ